MVLCMVTLTFVPYYDHAWLGECVANLASIQYLGPTGTIYSGTAMTCYNIDHNTPHTNVSKTLLF